MKQQLTETTKDTQAVRSRKLLRFLIVPAALCAGGLLTFVARVHTTKTLAAETRATAAEPDRFSFHSPFERDVIDAVRQDQNAFFPA
jgi:hypothetical protein